MIVLLFPIFSLQDFFTINNGNLPLYMNILLKINNIFHNLRYSTNKQFRCGRPARLGPNTGSGKNVCLDKQVKPGSSCIVYSFGYILFCLEFHLK